MRLSASQRACLIDATIDPLIAFPRGFARTKAGPFHRTQTIQSLVRSGALRVVQERWGQRNLKVTTRSEDV
jgi:hypothetical protein